MRKFLLILGLLLVVGYVIFAVFFPNKDQKDDVCGDFRIEMKDATGSYINTDELEKMIESKDLNPRGKQIKDINTLQIEQAIKTNQLVKSVEVYFTSTGGVRAIVEERKPLLRVIDDKGNNYYIDSDGNKMPIPQNFAANLPIATGSIKESFAKTDLYKFALFLYDDKFWNAQIEQIVVSSKQEITLVPRVGSQNIILGNLDDYQTKLSKLMLFYTKGLSKTGWNRYSEINLKYDRQVVCTKR